MRDFDRYTSFVRRATPFLLLLTALHCDRPPAAAPQAIRVSCTGYPLATIAKAVGGERVDARCLFELGSPPDPPGLTARERGELQAGRLVVGIGTRNEPWLSQDLGESLRLSNLVSLEELPIARTTPDFGLLWLDPFVARDIAFVLAERLTVISPDDRAAFEKNAADFVSGLEAILARYPNSAFSRAPVMTISRAFVPLLDRFGVRYRVFEGVPLLLSDDELAALRREAAKAGAATLLMPADTPAGAQRRVEARTGLRVVLIDPLGSSATGGRPTYAELLEFNLKQLADATR